MLKIKHLGTFLWNTWPFVAAFFIDNHTEIIKNLPIDEEMKGLLIYGITVVIAMSTKKIQLKKK